MSTSVGQTKAQALNLKLEGEAGAAIDQIEREHLRKVARKTFSCALACYDKAGSAGPSDVLENCVANCQMPHRQAQQMVQTEISQFQNRLNQAISECQYQAQDLMKPGFENDAKMTQRVEDKLITCMAGTVDKHIKLLKPLKDRVVQQLQQLK